MDVHFEEHKVGCVTCLAQSCIQIECPLHFMTGYSANNYNRPLFIQFEDFSDTCLEFGETQLNPMFSG